MREDNQEKMGGKAEVISIEETNKIEENEKE